MPNWKIYAAALCFAGAAALPSNSFAGAPKPVPFNWSGFYVGANAGYGFAHQNTSFTPLDAGASLRMNFFGFVPKEVGGNQNGGIAGLQAGYNWQAGRLVYGLEADLNFGQIKGIASAPPFGFPAGATITTSADTKVDWFGTLRARLGVAAFENSLLYATGGLAYGRVTNAPQFYENNGMPCSDLADFCSFSSTQKWKTGWTIGAGWETAIGNRWSAKVEYLYYDLGSVGTTMYQVNLPPDTVFSSSTRINGNIVRLGLNYKLN